MRGFQISPAGVDIFLVFDESIPADFVGKALAQWASLHPQEFTIDIDRLLEESALTTVLISRATHQQIKKKYPRAEYILSVMEDDEAFERLTVEVTLRMLESLSGSLHLFHAAALGDSSTGQAMLLVGPSGRGKTTASRFLGQHFSYLSDETAIIQDDFHLRPYPKPLSIITEGYRWKQQIDPASLGLKAVASSDYSFKLAHLILLDRDSQQSQPSLDRVPLADALLEIVEQTSGLLTTPDGVNKLIELVQRCGGALRLSYAEISDTLPLLTSLMSGELLLEPDRREISSESAEDFDTHRQQEAGDERLFRYPKSSIYAVDDRSLMVTMNRLIEISPFAADIWLALEHPLTAAQVKIQMEASYGPIPEEDFHRIIASLQQNDIII